MQLEVDKLFYCITVSVSGSIEFLLRAQYASTYRSFMYRTMWFTLIYSYHDITKVDVRRKKVLPFEKDEHQGGVDAALLKTVWF